MWKSSVSVTLVIGQLIIGLSVHNSEGGYCTEDVNTAIHNKAWPCLEPLWTNFSTPEALYNVSFVEQFCVSYANLRPCLDETLQDCGPDFIAGLYQAALQELETRGYGGYVFDIVSSAQEMCAGATAADDARQIYDYGQNLESLLNDPERRADLETCFRDWLKELGIAQSQPGSPLEDYLNSLIRWGQATYHCALNNLRHQANDESESLVIFIVNLTMPQRLDLFISSAQIRQKLSQNDFLTTRRSTIGVFGSQHLKVYSTENIQTCITPGWNIFLNNIVMRIEGRNSRLGESRTASIMTELKITFLESRKPVGTYRASGGVLPAKFVNNFDVTNPFIPDPIYIREVIPNSEIHIISDSLAYVLVVQRLEAAYMLTVRMSDFVLDTSDGLLVTGCQLDQVVHITPGNQSNDTQTELHQKCESACAEVGDISSDKYRATCVFDCLETGTIEYSTASRYFLDAMSDAEMLDSNFTLKDNVRPTTPAPSPESSLFSSTNHRTRYNPWIVVLTVLVLLRLSTQ